MTATSFANSSAVTPASDAQSAAIDEQYDGVSWYHIISIAFRDTLRERLSSNPGLSLASSSSVDSQWLELCNQKGIVDSIAQDDGEPDQESSIDANEYHSESSKDSDTVAVGDTLETAAFVHSRAPKSGRQSEKKRLGKPRKREPSAIRAAQRILKDIEELSNEEWRATTLPATESQALLGQLCGSSESVRQQILNAKPRKRRKTSHCTDSGPTVETSIKPVKELVVPKCANNAQQSIPQVINRRATKSSPLQYFNKSSSGLIFTKHHTWIHIGFSATSQNGISGLLAKNRRTLMADRLVMLCVRAKIRQNKGTPASNRPPFLIRNLTSAMLVHQKGLSTGSSVLSSRTGYLAQIRRCV